VAETAAAAAAENAMPSENSLSQRENIGSWRPPSNAMASMPSGYLHGQWPASQAAWRQ